MNHGACELRRVETRRVKKPSEQTQVEIELLAAAPPPAAVTSAQSRSLSESWVQLCVSWTVWPGGTKTTCASCHTLKLQGPQGWSVLIGQTDRKCTSIMFDVVNIVCIDFICLEFIKQQEVSLCVKTPLVFFYPPSA